MINSKRIMHAWDSSGLVGNMKEEDHWEDLCMDDRAILKWILEK
jgi:hypothetical protein